MLGGQGGDKLWRLRPPRGRARSQPATERGAARPPRGRNRAAAPTRPGAPPRRCIAPADHRQSVRSRIPRTGGARAASTGPARGPRRSVGGSADEARSRDVSAGASRRRRSRQHGRLARVAGAAARPPRRRASLGADTEAAFANGLRKGPLRKAMAADLPAEVVRRGDKVGFFAVPLARMLAAPTVHPGLDALLLPRTHRPAEVGPRDDEHQVFRAEYLASRRRWTDDELWLVLSTQKWLEQVEQQRHGKVGAVASQARAASSATVENDRSASSR